MFSNSYFRTPKTKMNNSSFYRAACNADVV